MPHSMPSEGLCMPASSFYCHCLAGQSSFLSRIPLNVRRVVWCVSPCRPSTQVIFTINGENSLPLIGVRLCLRPQAIRFTRPLCVEHMICIMCVASQ